MKDEIDDVGMKWTDCWLAGYALQQTRWVDINIGQSTWLIELGLRKKITTELFRAFSAD